MEDDSRGFSSKGGVLLQGGGKGGVAVGNQMEGGDMGPADSLIKNIHGLQPVQVDWNLKGSHCSRRECFTTSSTVLLSIIYSEKLID